MNQPLLIHILILLVMLRPSLKKAPTSHLPSRNISETYRLNQLKPSKKKTRLISIGESSKCMYFDSLVPINLGFLCRTILTVPGEIQLISVTEAVKVTIAAKEAPVEVLEEDVDGLQPPQVHSVARPDEDDGKDALVGKEVEREAPATGTIVTLPAGSTSFTCFCTFCRNFLGLE